MAVESSAEQAVAPPQFITLDQTLICFDVEQPSDACQELVIGRTVAGDKPVAWRIRTNAPTRYCVCPNSGVLDCSNSVAAVVVELIGNRYNPHHKLIVQAIELLPDESVKTIWRSDRAKVVENVQTIQLELSTTLLNLDHTQHLSTESSSAQRSASVTSLLEQSSTVGAERVKELEVLLAMLESDTQQMKRNVEQTLRLKEVLEKNLVGRNETKVELKKKIADAEVKMNALQEKVAKQEKLARNSEMGCEQSHPDHINHIRRISDVKETSDRNSQLESHHLLTCLIAAENRCKHAENENTVLRGENNDLKRQLETLCRKIENEAALRTTLEDKLITLKEDLDFARKAYASQMDEGKHKRKRRGTNKYPVENDFKRFISQNRGYSNGSTSTFRTSYYFDIAPKHFKKALDRFIHFFISPLFTESALEREVQAVDSDFLFGWSCDKFVWGNIETLWNLPRSKGIDVRDEMLKFFETNYTSYNMSLCVVANWKMQNIERAVLNLPFHEIPNRKAESEHRHKQLYKPEALGCRVDVVPVVGEYPLMVLFPVEEYTFSRCPGLEGHFRKLMGHTSKGSLIAELTEREWSHIVSAIINTIGCGLSCVVIYISVSEEGLRHVEEVVELLFGFIGTLQRCDLKVLRKYAPAVEPKHVHEVARGYACHLSEVPFEDIAESHNPELIKKLLVQLTPDTMMYFVMAKENAHLEELQKEKYFGTEFKKSKLSEELIRRFEKALVTPVEGLGLPDLKYDKIATKKMIRPKKMEENEYFRLWHVENAKYNNGMNVLLTVPSMLGDQVKQICTRTLVECFQYGEMEEPQKLRVKFHSRGFELCFSYIDSICDEFASFMEKIVDYTPGETAFNVTLKEVVKNLKNFEANQPYDQSKHLLSTVLTEGGCTPFELLEAAQTVTYAKFLEFIPQMWNALHLELLVYGNVAKEQVHQLASRLSNVFMEKNASIRALSPQELGPFVHLQIPAGNTLRCDHEQRIHPNSCTDVYLQIGSLDIRDTLLLDLVVKLISEPAFDALRTKEQLGYYVKALTHRSDGGQGLRCVVQGGHDPNYVEERIDVFLENFQKIIRSLSDGEFYRTRSLVSREVRSAPSGSRLVEPCWKEIKNGQCRFHFEKVAMKGEKELKKLTKEDLIEFYGTKIAPGAEQRRKLSVRLYSTQRANEAKNIGEEKATNVDSLMERLIIQ
ncbi:hypothetical protein QR680_008223 [Steinernema hermaphroditum]|uniref:MSP domain-containing protein n=1 Tax=Steinernema hermaphroditum TaxID=289476 RepID=A0AA39M7H5_9BILA|nr:hypothetical protein QR680_008223 [Steinernema hermaphroditum]